MKLYPLVFHPIFKERVWGGRHLERLYHKALPSGEPIGESWEISDRAEDVSVIANGPLAGKDLHWLVENHLTELLGLAQTHAGRFPLLIKILDAREKLSLQVHPPPGKAAELDGEPKTEMWYVTDSEPGAELYVGLKRGVTRTEFDHKLQAGAVAECFHHIAVKPGDAMFIPSGRVHAIGAGLVLFEIQQNSDTTYRVFDWNRLGLDGKPRALHIPQSLASIDFSDFEPGLVRTGFETLGALKRKPLVQSPLFTVEVIQAEAGASAKFSHGNFKIFGVVSGRLAVSAGTERVELGAGQFCLVPAAIDVDLRVQPSATFLLTEPGS